ncbi:MAG: helix-turn-helix transcriptional regulator [Eubacterium sp.]|nr:helix-turn-helix transcriptional regulator [Eubacterium sp.]
MIGSLNQQIGRRLREVRNKAGLTCEQMADLLEISDSHYRKIERGVYELKTEKLVRLRLMLGVDPLFLLMGETRERIDSYDADDENETENKTKTKKDKASAREINVIKELFRYCRAVSDIERERDAAFEISHVRQMDEDWFSDDIDAD